MEKLKFFGRDKELKQLKDFLEDDEKSVFLVGGRPGIGKTRLLEELADWLILDTGYDYVYPFKIYPEENSEQFLFRTTKSLEKHDSFWTGDKDKWLKAIKLIPKIGDLLEILFSEEDKRSLGFKFIDILKHFTRIRKQNERLIFLIDPEKYMKEDLKNSFITIWNELPQKVKFIVAQRQDDILITDPNTLSYPFVDTHRDMKYLLPKDSKAIVEGSALCKRLSPEQIENLCKRCEGWPLAIDATVRMLERSSDIESSISYLPSGPESLIQELYESVKDSNAKEILYYMALIPDFVALLELEKIINKDDFDTGFIHEHLHEKEVSALLDFEDMKVEGKTIERAKVFHPFFSEMLEEEMQKKGIYQNICKDLADYYYKLWKEDERDVTALMNIPLFYLKAGDEREYMGKIAEIFDAKYRLLLWDSLLSDLIKALKISIRLMDKANESYFLNNIGFIYIDKGEYDKALEYYEKSLKIKRKVYSEENLDTAISYNNIGTVYDRKGEYDKALEYYEKSLDIKLKVYNEEHPDTATSYNNIGTVYYSSGAYDKALE